jgi:hypothetical protein
MAGDPPRQGCMTHNVKPRRKGAKNAKENEKELDENTCVISNSVTSRSTLNRFQFSGPPSFLVLLCVLCAFALGGYSE